MSFLHSLKARLDGRQAANDASGAVPATPEEASVDVKPPGSVEADVGEKTEPLPTIEVMTVANPELNPGELSFEEDARGGMGRHLGVVGKIIGTGIFSTPSSILGSVGSVGASLMLWVLGFALSFCGLFIWLEFGSMFPRSGGEKVYLEAVYRRPKHLATVFFAANAILLGFTASGCIVFAQNILVTAGHDAERWTVRGIAIGVIVFATLVHGLTPRLGVWLINGLGISKIVILLFIVVSGWVVLSGRTGIEDPYANFRNSFAGSSDSSNDYATATFKVLHAYAGWENVNYVLNDVKDPVRTLKIAGPLGLGISTVLYLLANVSYFAAATKEEITNSGVTVASLFFKNVFGEAAQKALTVFVALSADGSNIGFVRYRSSYRNVVTVTYASGRINQELAKEGIPLPFGNRFWASTWPTGKTPLPGLLIHLIPSVIVIIAPPPDIAFPFILDVEQYPQQIINLLIVIGLLWLRWSKPDAPRVFKVWLPFAVFFLAAAVFLLVAPFLRPENGVGDTPPLPYYLYCLVGIGVMAFGVLYWAMWRIVPGWFGYEYVPHKATLSDGTVVTLFSKKRIE
ncbi:high affinity methionine permease [Trametes elegans]|nr:high affinity methionine permease [Trametes elegans]